MRLRRVVYANCPKEVREDEKNEILVITSEEDFAEYLQEKGIAAALDITQRDKADAGDGLLKKFSCSYAVMYPKEMEFGDFDRIYRRQKGLPWTILTTERTVVREFCMSDLKELMELYDQPGIAEWTQPLRSYEEEAEYQRDYIHYMYGLFGYGMWLVTDRATGKIIGRAGIESNEACEPGEAELGYVIHPKLWNQGIATEVCEALLCYARRELGLDRFFVRIKKGNAASLAVAKKLGIEKVRLL